MAINPDNLGFGSKPDPTGGFFGKFGEFGTTSGLDSRSSSSTFFSDPKLAKSTSGALGNLAQNATSNYMGFLQNPTSHPLFQAQLGPLLQSLIPSENRARTSLTDTFRAAGGLRSGAYGREATMLEGELMQRRQQAAAQLLGQSFGQIMSALGMPIGQIPSLLNALKLSQSQGADTRSSSSSGSGWESMSPSLGLATPMSPTPGFDAYAAQLSAPRGPGSATVGPNYTPPPPAKPFVPYQDPWGAGSGNSIVQNPYTGVYQTIAPYMAGNDQGLLGYAQGYDAAGNAV